MRKLAPFGLILVVAALGWGLASILALRFGGGNIYPPGSSLRVDPLGTRVLHDSLAQLRPVQRNFGNLERQDLSGATVFLLQVSPSQLGEMSWRKLTERGARVVMAFAPVLIQRRDMDLEDLDLKLVYSVPTEEMKETAVWETSRSTTLSLVTRSPEWTTLLPGRLIERQLDRGSLVVAANADLFSNRSLGEHAASTLLAHLVGPATRIVFDESHLGIRDEPGVMVLVRRYGLTGLVVALAILALLFVWQAAFPLVPLPAEASASLELQSERSAQAGLAQLLRRGVPPRELLTACLREWERLDGQRSAKREAVRRALAEAPDPVTAFARATQALERKV